MLSILAQAPGNFVLPPQASTVAKDIDWVMYFVLWVCLIFGALIFIGTALLAWKYRHRPGVNDVGSGPTHSNFLEIFWSVVPFVIVVLIAIWGFQAYLKYSVLPPAEALEIQVEGRKWNWSFTYPNGHVNSQLHVPKGVPVRLVLTSPDVIHSLYFPEFRVKKDVVPGRYNKFWFTATMESPLDPSLPREKESSYELSKDPTDEERAMKSGAGFGFDIFCAEYCGTSHSKMLSKVHVHPDIESYRAWLEDASDIWKEVDGVAPSGVDVGRRIAAANCLSCHSTDGTANTGPTWKDMFGKQGTLNNGQPYTADEDYIRDSIIYPQKQIVAGFGPSMPSFIRLSDREIAALIAYMKSLSSHYKGDPTELQKPIPPMEDKPR